MKYVNPTIELIDCEDVITTSGGLTLGVEAGDPMSGTWGDGKQV